MRRSAQISPGFVSVTLGGADLAHFTPSAPDEAVRLFFPRDGQDHLIMPTVSNQAWTIQMLAQPVTRRPWVRLYTARAFRPDLLELDVEIALHGNSPASRWARGAAPGSPAGILDEGHTYRYRTDTDWELLAGDESALPAIVAILEQAPPDYRAQVYCEIANTADIRALPNLPVGVDLHWLPRGDNDEIPGRLALRTITDTILPNGRFTAWIAGEQRLPSQLRRHLISRGIAKRDITFTGYWRRGRASLG
ncbi:siderophore-interacting protein [Plantactinospora sp. WMMC1484]|uniref:siderophore-interacting protein n=1 Tax=Plantactinospora sp. WMMC1484 TaxID=3404122 RepID=UPI003BF4D3A3